MQVVPVHELRIFDVAHVEDRGRKLSTLLSMEIDGTRVYSISLDRVVNPVSCFETVAMFKNGDRRSIYAWLDPSSKECFILNEISLSAAFFLCHMAALMTGAVAAIITHDRQLAIVCAVSMAFVCACIGLWDTGKFPSSKASCGPSTKRPTGHPHFSSWTRYNYPSRQLIPIPSLAEPRDVPGV
jgi:hypothetical protein